MSTRWIDSSDYTHLAMCPCGWRQLCLTPERAENALIKHEAGWHPQRHTARNAIHNYHYRARQKETRHPGDKLNATRRNPPES
ncbi:hypothetical protein F4555_001349 [Mobiluncus mulieris]|uniref:Uncharacterized protein n=1 Tax=Mobiluncus mulieris TaxID=2052 RepID=A0A8G2M5Y3_9ACTO|nr:hypothetical protein [Mobiluncus mulieris]MBB5846553.1 hypothetical protein [Mobiluncus mulieris]MCV0011713.1 hypothetical protein [Mobiluncus mulieris]STO16971.1 Uncharacterised protein [Mobiluncus mulieris]